MLKNIITQYKKKSFLIAYSGGVDSTVLLHKMFKIKEKNPQIKIRAIHINHNVHSSSKEWEKHCIKICQKYKIPLIIKEINISLKNNIEEKLRIARYNIIYNYLLYDEILLTGHHLNDQCETLILSLKRGSGPTGLSGMSSESFLGKKRIYRPFLNKTKQELEKWAYENNLQWIEDFNNINIDYDRNFIRHKLIPILEQRWPFFLKNCFRTTVICREETNLKNIFLKEKIQNFINFNESLDISNFKNIKKEICKALIRYWISLKKTKMPSYTTIECIYNEIICSKKDANPKITIQKNEIRRYKQALYFIKIQKNISNKILFWHETNKKLFLSNTLGYLVKNKKGFIVPIPKKNELINIRFQVEGKILILGRDRKRKIKKIWQEYNIPPWLRNQIPLLFYNHRFIAAIGVFVVKEEVFNQKKEIKKSWQISWINRIQLNDNNFFSFY